MYFFSLPKMFGSRNEKVLHLFYTMNPLIQLIRKMLLCVMFMEEITENMYSIEDAVRSWIKLVVWESSFLCHVAGFMLCLKHLSV